MADPTSRTTIEDGYYWFRCHADGSSTFIALLEDGTWWMPGHAAPVLMSPFEMIGPVERPRSEALQ